MRFKAFLLFFYRKVPGLFFRGVSAIGIMNIGRQWGNDIS